MPGDVKQAVILAGGKGTRLGGLTRYRPKPMIEVAGKPFLCHLLTLLRQRGIKEVLLLTGFLGESILDYIGNGERWGLNVTYSHTPVEDKTGRRLASVVDRFDGEFLLMYADVYWPLPLERMAKSFDENPQALALVAAYTNRERITRNNLRVDEADNVQLYDKTRRGAGLTHVDSGYLLCRREIVDYFPPGNFSLEEAVYPRLVQDGRMAAFPTEQRHFSIDTPEKIESAEIFFDSGRTVFIDRDGTINRSAARWDYIRSWEAFEFLEGAVEGIRTLKKKGFRVIVVTNQAGIARGEMSLEQVDEIHEKMKEALNRAGAPVDAVYTCPHGWDDGCFCRKPSPGLLYRAANELAFDLSHAVLIGDQPTDLEAAERAGIPGIQVTEEYSLLDVCKSQISPYANDR